MTAGLRQVLGAASSSSSGPWSPADPEMLTIRAQVHRWWPGFRYPFSYRVSSKFGSRVNPVTAQPQFHTGLDLPTVTGSICLAVWDATVERVDVDRVGRGVVNGNAVMIRSGQWTFCYLHLSQVLVKPGQTVYRGQVLGLTGSTGRSTGPHLHFQVYYLGRVCDPSTPFPPGLFPGSAYG